MPNRNYKFLIGVVLAIFSAITFSGKAIFVKLAYRYGIPASSLLCLRLLFALPFFLAIIVHQHVRQKKLAPLTRNDYLTLGLFGAIGFYASSLLDFLGLELISAGLERIILYSYPALVVIGSRVFFKEQIDRYRKLALLLTYAGLVLAFVSEIKPGMTNVVLGTTFVLGSAIFYAFYMIGSQKVIPRLGSLRFTAYSMSVASITGLLHQFSIHQVNFTGYAPEVYQLAFAMAVFSTVIPLVLQSEAVSRIGASSASIIGTLGPISTITLAHTFLGEEITLLQILGSLLVLSGIVLLGKRPQKIQQIPTA